MCSSQAYIGRNSRLYKCGVLQHTLEGLVACFKCGVLKHTLEGLLACLNVEFSSIHWKVFLLVSQAYIGGILACIKVEAFIGKSSSCLFKGLLACKCGVFKHTLEGLLACLNVEFSSIHWKVFLLV